MQSQYVGKFFDDGSVKISSFRAFAEHPNEHRKDTREGGGIRTGTADSGSGVIMASARGINSYVLCGTMSFTGEIISKFSDCDACLAIDNTTEFARLVGLAIPHFVGGIEGSAIYQDETVLSKSLGAKDPQVILDKHRTSEGNFSFEAVSELLSVVGGNEEFFIKHSDYAKENEYRLVWHCQVSTEQFIDIKIPEARKLCRRLKVSS